MSDTTCFFTFVALAMHVCHCTLRLTNHLFVSCFLISSRAAPSCFEHRFVPPYLLFNPIVGAHPFYIISHLPDTPFDLILNLFTFPVVCDSIMPDPQGPFKLPPKPKMKGQSPLSVYLELLESRNPSRASSSSSRVTPSLVAPSLVGPCIRPNVKSTPGANQTNNQRQQPAE